MQHIYSHIIGKEDNSLQFEFPYMEIGNSCVNLCRQNQFQYFYYTSRSDYVCNIDIDQTWGENDLTKMVELDKDIVIAPVISKVSDEINIYTYSSEDKLFHAMKSLPSSPFQLTTNQLGGFGMIMFSRKAINQLWQFKGRDLFVAPKYHPYGGSQVSLGEDFSCLYWAHQIGLEIWCDTRITTGHLTYEERRICSVK
jgi:hypothetical protein